MKHVYEACLETSPDDYGEFYKVPVSERESHGDFNPHSIDDWVTLGQFFLRNWFFRVWCVQDIAYQCAGAQELSQNDSEAETPDVEGS